jgi:hypothetical protein
MWKFLLYIFEGKKCDPDMQQTKQKKKKKKKKKKKNTRSPFTRSHAVLMPL